MKTWKLLLFSLVPMVFGWLVNRLILTPVLGTFLLFGSAWITAAFCLWLGWRCARSGTRFCSALLLTQWLNVLSLGLYVWQFHLCSDETRSFFWAGLSQYPAVGLNMLSARIIGVFFHALDLYAWGPRESLILCCLSVCLLLVLFSCGYLLGKRAGASHA